MLSVNNSPEATRLWFYKKSGIFLHHFCYPAGRLDSLLHMHDEYNIIFCLSGVFEYCIRDTCERVEPGDLLVINPGEMHHGRYGCGLSDSTGLTLHVTERAIKEMMHRMRLPVDVERSSVSFLGKVNVPALFPLAHELLSELEERQHGYEMVAEALVVQFVVRLLRHCLHPVVQLPQRFLSRQLPSWQMVRALEYMNSRGKSSTAFSVKEVSYELGFQNESHFCRVFRACTGLTPSGFRLSEPGSAEAVQSSIHP